MYEQLVSTVIEGKQLWRTIWFPTLNCPIDDNTFDLPTGTYRVNVIIEWVTYRGIGPRFSELRLFEVHLIETQGNFYSTEVVIIPLVKIRDNQQFSSLDELQKQLHKDLQRAEEHPQVSITFGTFDHFHPGHEAYLRQAKQYGDYLITVIARDETVSRIKWHQPDEDENQRFNNLLDLDYVDIVELGNSEDPYTCLREYTPQLICLWYDQHSFDTWLREWCDSHEMQTTNIIRLPSFAPEKWKSSYFRTKK